MDLQDSPHAIPRIQPIRTTCAYCGKEFRARRSWQKFCSQKCREDLWAGSKRVTFPVVQESTGMDCRECMESAETKYRWRNAVVKITACSDHLAELVLALNLYQEAHYFAARDQGIFPATSD